MMGGFVKLTAAYLFCTLCFIHSSLAVSDSEDFDRPLLSVRSHSESLVDKEIASERSPLTPHSQEASSGGISIGVCDNEEDPIIALQNKVSVELTGQTSAVTAYQYQKIENDDKTHLQNPTDLTFITIHNVDNILFDDARVPRKPLRCCHPKVIKFLEVLGGVIGMGSLTLIAPGFTNGLLGELFQYEPYGNISIGFMVVSAILTADIAFFQFFDLVKKLISKKRGTFIESQSKDDEKLEATDPSVPAILPTSRVSQFIKWVGLPFLAAGYASQPVGLWLELEKGFWQYALPLSVPMLLFYGKLYYEMANTQWVEWDITRRYIQKDHGAAEERRALIHSLSTIKQLLINDKTSGYKLTQAIWIPIAKRTNNFGSSDFPKNYTSKEFISAISCLLCKSDLPEGYNNTDGQSVYHIQFEPQNKIEEATAKSKLIGASSKVVMALNLFPNFK